MSKWPNSVFVWLKGIVLEIMSYNFDNSLIYNYMIVWNKDITVKSDKNCKITTNYLQNSIILRSSFIKFSQKIVYFKVNLKFQNFLTNMLNYYIIWTSKLFVIFLVLMIYGKDTSQ